MKSIFLTLLFGCLGMMACKKNNRFDCFKRTGVISAETRLLADFYIIDVYNNMNVFLIQDTINYVAIKAGSNLLSNIETSIEGTKLTIKNNNKCNFTRSYKQDIEVYIHFKKLDELIYQGTGPVTSINAIVNNSFIFNCWDGTDSVKLNLEVPLVNANIHTGVADLIVKGHAQQLFAYARSSGVFRMQQFVCENVYSNNVSSSDHFFYVKNKLEALVQYKGNTYYMGHPSEIIKTENNEGKLIPLN